MSKADLKGLAAREAGSVKDRSQTINARARDPRFVAALERIKDGQSIRGACGLSGMPRATLYEWMDADKEIKQLVDDALDEGFGVIELKLMQGASQADDTDWRAISWMLARRFPAEYGEKQSLEVTHKKEDGIPEVIAMLEQTQHLVAKEPTEE